MQSDLRRDCNQISEGIKIRFQKGLKSDFRRDYNQISEGITIRFEKDQIDSSGLLLIIIVREFHMTDPK